jgi:hypothetical protein
VKKWLWLALVPTLLFAETLPPRFQPMRQNPVYIDVENDRLTIHPEKTVILKEDVRLPDGEFAAFLDRVEAVRESDYIVLLLRPGSAVFQRDLRNQIRARGIDVGFEPWEAGREVVIPTPETPEPDTFGIQKAAALKQVTVADAADIQPIMVRPVNNQPVEVEVRAHSLTIGPDQIVVTREELNTPGNAFELLLDQFEAKGDCPRICLSEQPGGKSLRIQLGEMIQERGERMGYRMGMVTNQITVLVSTPREATGMDKSPVFFECRNRQLFSITPERLRKACDEKTAELRKAADGDETRFLHKAAGTTIEMDGFRLDYTYALMGRYALTPLKDACGYEFQKQFLDETDDMWFGSRLAALDSEKQFLCFYVRPDSLQIFQQARALAWMKNLDVTCELLEENEPILIAPGGSRIMEQ